MRIGIYKQSRERRKILKGNGDKQSKTATNKLEKCSVTEDCRGRERTTIQHIENVNKKESRKLVICQEKLLVISINCGQ